MVQDRRRSLDDEARLLASPGVPQQLSDPLATLVFSGFNHATEYTIVAGKVVVDKGRLAGFNEEELAAKANAISQAIIQRHGN